MKKMLLVIFCAYSGSSSATPFQSFLSGSIHTIMISSSWCGNIGLSTKVGKLTKNNQCIYEKETEAHGTDKCGPHYLNGGELQNIVGSGYNCVATHAYSNVTGKEGFDEYRLISDENGNYIATYPNYGQIILK